MSIRTYHFFQTITVSATSFPSVSIKFVDQKTSEPFITRGIIITNDSTDPLSKLEVSFGKDSSGSYTVDAVLNADETLIFEGRREREVNFRKAAGSDIPVRIIAW